MESVESIYQQSKQFRPDKAEDQESFDIAALQSAWTALHSNTEEEAVKWVLDNGAWFRETFLTQPENHVLITRFSTEPEAVLQEVNRQFETRTQREH